LPANCVEHIASQADNLHKVVSDGLHFGLDYEPLAELKSLLDYFLLLDKDVNDHLSAGRLDFRLLDGISDQVFAIVDDLAEEALVFYSI